MGRKILVPFDTSGDLSWVTGGNSGFLKLNTTTTLTIVSDQIPLGKIDKESDGGHAIPSPVAHIDYVADSIINVEDNRENQITHQWRGIMAMIGLTNMYNFQITMEPIDYNQMDGRTNQVLGSAFRSKMGNRGFLIRKEGVPIALTHNRVIICPFKKVDHEAEIFQNVPWYQDGKWQNVCQCLQEHEKQKLAGWLASFPVDGSNVVNQIQAFIKDLSAAPMLGTTRPLISEHLKDELAIVPIGFNPGAQNDSFANVPGFSTPYPAIFNPSVTIATGIPGSRLGTSKSLFFTSGNSYFNVLSPLTEDMTDLLDDPDVNISLKNIEVHAKDFSLKKELEIIAVFLIDGVEDRKSRVYKTEEINLVQAFPYVSLWPYVDLPKGEWKQYYFTLYENDSIRTKIFTSADKIRRIETGKNGTSEIFIQGCKKKESVATGYEWKLAIYPFIPKFLHFYARLNGTSEIIDLGVVFIDRPTEPALVCNACTIPFKIAIDFGTTNSICMIHNMGDESLKLVDKIAVKVLCGATTNNTADLENFHDHYWVPLADKEGKVPSISLLYNTPMGTGVEPFEQGKMLYVDESVLNSLMEMCPGSNFQTIGVYSDLKFGAGRMTGNVQEKFAAHVFIMNMLLDAVLQAKLHGAQTMELRVSIPSEEFQRGLTPIWNSVVSFITSNITNGLTLHQVTGFVTEAEAASRCYQKRLGGDIAADPFAGYAIVDIGGGTSDISLWKASSRGSELAECKGSVSLQYAGRRMIIQSIFNLFHQRESMGLFRKLWKNTTGPYSDKINSLIEQYELLAPSIDLLGSMEDDPKYKSARSIIETLIERAHFNYDFIFNPMYAGQFHPLLLTLKLKFFSVFYVVTQFITMEKACDCNPGIYRIFTAGGSSRALQLCEDGLSMDQFNVSGFGTFVRAASAYTITGNTDDYFYIDIQGPVITDKQEVVKGLLVDVEVSASQSHPTPAPARPSFGGIGGIGKKKAAEASGSAEALTMAPMKKSAGTKIVPTGELQKQLKEDFEDYLENYILPALSDLSGFDAEEYINKFTVVGNPAVNKLFARRCGNLANEVYGNPEYPDALKRDIFIMLMFDEVVNAVIRPEE